jgi:hypothetical protein
MFSERTTQRVYIFIVIFGLFAGTSQAKSLYVIKDTELSRLSKYKISGSSLVFQIDYNCVSDIPGVYGAVGLAIDESADGNFLFVTFESIKTIEIVDANTMQFIDDNTIPGASNLAGIVVDKGKRQIHALGAL